MSERHVFGERLKRHRERRGVTLQAIAQATKISASLFAALERGDCSRWPAGVYSRAYVRAYAEAIGLDPEEVVEDFSAAFVETAHPESFEKPAGRRVKAVGALRLSMVEEPAVRQERFIRRAAFAAADLLVASGVAWLAHAWLDTALWTTVGIALGYHASGRLLTDQSLVYWLFHRSQASPAPAADGAASDEVSVSDAASTTA